MNAQSIAPDDTAPIIDENGLDAADRIRNALVETLDAIDSGRLSTRKLITRLSPKINDFLATPGAGERVQRWTLGDLQRRPELMAPPPAVVPRLAWHERVTMVSALPKRGKTTVVAHGVAALSQGRQWLGQETAGGKALWLFYEGHPGDVVRTFTQAGGHESNVIIARCPPGEWSPLVQLLKEERPVVTVIDTLASFALNTLVMEASRPDHWTPVMNAFARYAQEYHTSFILIHHDKKSGGYADSRAIGAGVDMIINIPGDTAEDPSPKRLLNGVGRFPYTNCAIRLESGRFVLEDGIAGTPSIELRVLDFIREHPGATKTQLREFIGGRKDAPDEAVTRLLARGLIEDRGSENKRQFHAAETQARDDGPARVPASHAADLADVVGQGLTQGPANRLARSGPPIGGQTATVATANGTEPPKIHPCRGGCGHLFSRPELTCNACRQRSAEQ